MGTEYKIPTNKQVLLVYYSPEARKRLEAVICAQHLEVYSIDGRAADSPAKARNYSAAIVVIDHGADDVIVAQAVRQLGQIQPNSVVVAVYPHRSEVTLYQKGHRTNVLENLETALRKHAPQP